MAAKRALIVDDSRSARVILSRMLESYGLQVDAAETAEQAFEFLEHHRPDVIFMDHLMPGMDGFQAVQALKANPATAMIPVMMYTSQEGELYVGQARALGAVGVLPKTVKHADVSRVLYQLNLLGERRENRAALFVPPTSEDDDTAEVQVASARAEQIDQPSGSHAADPSLRVLLDSAFKEQQIELRRFMLASFEAFVRRISADIKAGAPPPAADDPAIALAETSQRASASRWPWLIAVVAVVALLPTLILGAFYLRIMDTTRSLTDTNARLAALVAGQQAQINALRDAPPNALAPADPAAVAANPPVDVEAVGYGEVPLSGGRVDKLRALLARLKVDGFKGVVRVETFIGDFCLAGNAIEGYSLAADDLPARRCDVTGNPFEDGLTGAQRQSLPFANLAASIAQETGGGIRIEVIAAGRRPMVPYPAAAESLTAGEWNRAATRNNRVEFTIEPVG
ncbi:MAG: response regulator [Steroidobacteraceae bacterium]